MHLIEMERGGEKAREMEKTALCMNTNRSVTHIRCVIFLFCSWKFAERPTAEKVLKESENKMHSSAKVQKQREQ